MKDLVKIKIEMKRLHQRCIMYTPSKNKQENIGILVKKKKNWNNKWTLWRLDPFHLNILEFSKLMSSL
jgi:hypothetical protein